MIKIAVMVALLNLLLVRYALSCDEDALSFSEAVSAIGMGDFQQFSKIVEKMPLGISHTDDQGDTLLHKLARRPVQDPMFFILLYHRKRVNLNAKTSGGMTPLMIAVSSGNALISTQLLCQPYYEKDCDIDAQDDWGRTALHHAVLARDKVMVERLLKFDAKRDIQDQDGCTPLNLAKKLSLNDIAALFNRFEQQNASTYRGLF